MPAPTESMCAWLLEHEPSGLFAAGGTGEFFSLTARPRSARSSVRPSRKSAGRVPVIAGCGYGTAMAIELARDAEKRGADGLLLLPPYLVNADQQGLAAHIEKVCRSVSIGVIVYNRDNAIVTEETLAGLCERNANLVGFKDGVGDLELLARVYSRLGKRAHLHRRHAHGGNLRAAVSRHRLRHLFIGHLQFHAGVGEAILRRRARRRSRNGADTTCAIS